MTTNIDEMTSEQLRDALAVAAGWEPFDYIGYKSWKLRGSMCHTSHPVPSLDSPEALGVVAGMLQKPFCVSVHESYRNGWQALARPSLGDNLINAVGPTEVIARAKLVLKVLAATRKEDEEKQ